MEVAFERSLAEFGVELINAGPYHPQTLGKLERFHKTLKEWLADEGPAEDLPHLQELLDGFRHHYNAERPHQGIGELTPAERYGGASLPPREPRPPSKQDIAEPTYPPHCIVRKVTSVGNISYDHQLIQLGRRWAHARVRLIPVGSLLHVYWGDVLVRVLALDPNSYYQPLRGRR